MVDEATAHSLLTKLREFARTLDDDERELFAVLVGPGVAQVLGSAEVAGFASGGREHERLARGLVEFYRRDRTSAEDDVTGNSGSVS